MAKKTILAAVCPARLLRKFDSWQINRFCGTFSLFHLASPAVYGAVERRKEMDGSERYQIESLLISHRNSHKNISAIQINARGGGWQ